MSSSPKIIQLPRQREARLAFIRRCFPHISQSNLADLKASWVGGRVNALKKLANIKGITYGQNRNFLNGEVTHLSPYLRHGCIHLPEVAQSIKLRFGVKAQKLLFELAWRDYWRQVWYAQGDRIVSDMQPAKVVIGRQPLPDDIRQAKTALPCIDAFIHDLINEGYLHNHARMWLAAYIVHWRKIDWRAAADWFVSHLLDGDTASNHLSWQWVASTFSGKPYFFNKENLSKYSAEKYCNTCHASCPFDASYELLSERLFTPSTAPAKIYKIAALPETNIIAHQNLQLRNTIVLIHDEMLSAEHTLLNHQEKKVFIIDPLLHGDWSLNRLQFLADCLIELEDVEIWQGDTRQVLATLGATKVITQSSPNPHLQRLLANVEVDFRPETAMVNVTLKYDDLRSFSKYWQKVGPLLLS